MAALTIDVVSDVICPWCFVGKRRLEAALAAARVPAATSVRWRPFFLDPSLPAAGTDKRARYEAKFGAARVAAMLPSMAAVGAECGIAFDFGGKVAATTPAHALLEAAWERGGARLQDALAEALFRFYFERRGNPGDAAALASLAADAGLPAADAAAVLAGAGPGGAHAVAVERDAAAWRARFNVTGVPFFVISDGSRTTTLSGAQDVGVFVETFNALLEQ